jgi:hypothetical protein
LNGQNCFGRNLSGQKFLVEIFFGQNKKKYKNLPQGSILVCKIFTFLAKIVDKIFGRNENWIFVYFPGKFSAKMRDTRTKFSFWSKISSTISAEIVGAKYHLLNHRF